MVPGWSSRAEIKDDTKIYVVNVIAHSGPSRLENMHGLGVRGIVLVWKHTAPKVGLQIAKWRWIGRVQDPALEPQSTHLYKRLKVLPGQ